MAVLVKGEIDGVVTIIHDDTQCMLSVCCE